MIRQCEQINYTQKNRKKNMKEARRKIISKTEIKKKNENRKTEA